MSKRNEAFLNSRLKAMYGPDFDPIIKIAENAVRIQRKIEKAIDEADDDEAMSVALADLVEANKEWERMAQFTTPKLKSVEHVGDQQITEVHIHR